jgi:hypothetical protein
MPPAGESNTIESPERPVAFPKELSVKSCACLILLIAAAACQPAGGTPEPPAPVFVPAMCTLMGNPPRSEVPAGSPVILMWGWSALTQDQMEDYLRAGIVRVALDGNEVQGRQQGGISFDKAAGIYRAVWTSNVGIPTPGLHAVTYSLTFREKIFDGFAYYGPGTKNETQEDRCEIEVK